MVDQHKGTYFILKDSDMNKHNHFNSHKTAVSFKIKVPHLTWLLLAATDWECYTAQVSISCTLSKSKQFVSLMLFQPLFMWLWKHFNASESSDAGRCKGKDFAQGTARFLVPVEKHHIVTSRRWTLKDILSHNKLLITSITVVNRMLRSA